MEYYFAKRCPWFCHDPEGDGMTWHATEDDAHAHAHAAIESWNEDGGWPDEETMTGIIVGQVIHSVCQTDRKEYANGDYVCNYDLKPLIPDTQDPAR